MTGLADAVAVVGMSCRLPAAADPRALWQLLREGRDAIAETPAERWALGGMTGPGDAPPGLRHGGFLDQVDRFDARFFGVSPREAAAMDPQQRLVLELCWEALEDAGIVPGVLTGSQTGIYVGAITSDYEELAQSAAAEAVARTFTGTQRGIIANRVSYALGLRGPSMTVDTGQSSSLVAVHLACQSLRAGESTLALAGGVQLNLGSKRALALAKLGALSPDGRCFTFDARANGFVRGEGGGVVVLKPLEIAIAGGDPIYCVIRGSAVNNDGGGDGLTAPEQEAQEQLLQSAYRQAGVPVGDVQYVELHGTGTPLGDKVEAAALGAVLGAGRAARPLVVGSAKTNVGHLEAGAGIVGLLKVALAIEHGEVPASLNFERPNPEIPLEDLGLRVPTSAEPWSEAHPVVAGVSSFGIGGTNCHVVVEAPPEHVAKPAGATPCSPVPWVVSGKSHGAVRDNARRLADHLEAEPGVDAGDVARALATVRTSFGHRAVVVADEPEQLLDELRGLAEGRPPSARVVEGVADVDLAADRPVFVFPGQGGQWAGMGAELVQRSPAFAAAMRECDELLSEPAGFSVDAVLRGAPGAPSLERIEVVQPVLFAIMVSLARLWQSSGVQPAAVVGHSQGEIAAAHIAGGLSLEDAARIVVVRSRALSRLAGVGGMLSVGLSLDEFEQRAQPFGDRLTVAAINAPRSLVVSGDPAAIEQLAQSCEAGGVPVRRIQSTVPGHSPHVEAVREEVLDGLASVTPRAAAMPVFSTVTGERIDTAVMDAEHWYRNLRQTVRFAPAVAELLGDGTRTFIEVGPHPVLTVPVEAIAEEALGDPGKVAVLATLRRDQGGPQRFATALAELHVRGGQVDWRARLGAGETRRLRLPTYAFERERHWLDAVAAARPVEPGVAVQGEPEVTPAAESSFAARVAGLAEAERGGVVLDAVLGEAAVVLGHASPSDVDPRSRFKDLGFDSPGIVELRNRVNALTGLRLSSSALFDVPTPGRLAERILADLTGAAGEARVARSPARVDEPIAIVGMACRYPGGVASAEDLWDLVASGRDAIGEFPTGRGWDLQRLFDPDGGGPGTSYVNRGGFLYDAADFDAEHFGISPREALAMDPQQRLLLECSWEALEDAGIDPSSLRGSGTGVFAGVMAQEYGPRLYEPDDRSAGYALTGTGTSVVSGRVSYVLGLEGPAVSVDTACSSSLVALHLAAQALRAGECDLALACGASVMALPGVFVEFSRQRGLSPDGRCRAFGAGANGTGWSEGAGILVVERLSVARERGHRVLAVVRGSATNQDGASNGLTAPSGASQERVIRAALASAGLAPSDVDAVEAHGTGTALGDPIEAQALLATYGQGRSDGPAYLGSLKSNLGHTQAAAGVGGVIKMVQALRHERLPQTLWAQEPSPHVDWDAGELALLDESVPWPAGGRVRRAGVSSFGMSGTNAHVVLEEAPADVDAGGPPEIASRVLPFVVSASSEAGLVAQAERLGEFAAAHPELDPAAVAGSLASTRARLAHRAVALVGGLDELGASLGGFARGELVESVAQGVARRDRRVAFVFPGQGGQWEGMGVALWDASPEFAQHMRACGEALAEHVDWDLEAVLRGAPGAPSLDRVDVVQPALFAVMVSLARLWESFGVAPAAVVGHSQGEIAAAHVAGALSLQDAARVVAVRSRVLGEMLSGLGGMLAVGAGREAVEAYLQRYDGRVSLAAVNSPSSVVVSGEPAGLHDLIARCEADGVPAKLLPVDYAAHSVQIEVMRERLLEEFAPVRPRAGDVPLYSTVTGERLDTAAMDAGYWYRNLRETVRFDEAVRALVPAGIGAVVEVGPHPVLGAAVMEALEAAGHDADAVAVIGSVRRSDAGLERFIRSLAEADVIGVDVGWGRLLGRTARVPLPAYAFQHRHYWLTPGTEARDPSALGQATAQHPLLDATIDLPAGQVSTGRLSLERHPWLADHVVMGQVLLPATAFLDLALHIGTVNGAPVIDELTLSAPLTLGTGQSVALRVTVTEADDDGRRQLTIHSRLDGAGWTQHAAATLALDSAGDSSELQRLAGTS